jgi:hypothetical protein
MTSGTQDWRSGSMMTTGHRRIFAVIVACVLGVTATVSAGGQKAHPESSGCIGVCPGQIAIIGAGVAAAGTAIGIGIYFAVHHNHSLTGCASVTPDGLRLRRNGDQQSYSLVGEIAAVKPGNRVRVSGNRQKKNGDSPQVFIVEKLARDYGSCKVQPAVP